MPVVVECAGTVRFFGPRLGFQTIVLHSLLWTSPVFKHLLCVSSPNNTSQSLWNHKKVKTLFLFFLTQGLDKFTDIIDHHLSTDHMIRVDILTYHVLACILLEFLLLLSEGYHGASVQLAILAPFVVQVVLECHILCAMEVWLDDSFFQPTTYIRTYPIRQRRFPSDL